VPHNLNRLWVQKLGQNTYPFVAHLLRAMLDEAQVGQVIEMGIDHLLSKHTERVTGAPTVKTCPST